MDLNEHARNIGVLVCNLQSIEYQLRCFLSWARYPELSGLAVGSSLSNLHEGTEHAEGNFTNFDPLSLLVKKFNDFARERRLRQLDTSIVVLRDVLAHGRCAGEPGAPYFRLIKFSRPKHGRVVVTYNQELDPRWHDRQQRLLSEAFYVLDAARQRS